MQKMILILCILIPMGSTSCSKDSGTLKFDPVTTVIQELIKKGVNDDSGR